MEICGKPVRKNFGNPYKTKKEGGWLVNIIVDGKKTKLKLEFNTKPEADEYILVNDNKWFVSITDAGHNFIRDETFGDIKSAQAYVRQSREDNKQAIKDNSLVAAQDETTFLEDRIGIGTEMPMITDDSGDPEVDEQLQNEIKKHKDDFDGSLISAEEDAKSLLMSVAKLYLDENIIKDNDYIKFKMVIESKGLSSLIFQLDIARKALFKLSEQIHSGTHSPRNYEVLTQLQRIILDVTKYQHEYLDDIEESMKKLAEDYETGKTKDGTQTAEVVESQNGEVTIIGTSNRVKLLEDINAIVTESKENKTPQSVNKNLHIEADDMTDAIEIKTGDEEETKEDDEDTSQLGLESM